MRKYLDTREADPAFATSTLANSGNSRQVSGTSDASKTQLGLIGTVGITALDKGPGQQGNDEQN